ncbi:hypothetical protein BLOT_010828, partial [Blomia tropicalis]
MMAIVQLVITRHDKRLLLSQFHIDDARHVILNVGRQNNYDSNQLLDKTKPTLLLIKGQSINLSQ